MFQIGSGCVCVVSYIHAALSVPVVVSKGERIRARGESTCRGGGEGETVKK